MSRLIDRVDGIQRAHSALAYPVAVFTRFKEHNGPRLAANVSYFAFFSVFPLFLAFTSILGIVLDDNDDLREDLVDSVVSSVPVIGAEIEKSTSPLTGSVPVVVVGIAFALWAGLRMIDSLAFAINELWDVPPTDRPASFVNRLKGLIVLGVFGLGMIGATILTGLPEAADLGAFAPLVGIGASMAANILVVAVSVKVLAARPLTLGDIWLGAVLAGIALVVLQTVGVRLVQQLEGASNTYGAFAGVIGMLAFFHLTFRALLLSLEVSVVRQRRLVPRTLSTKVNHRTDGDRRALLLDVQRVQRDDRIGYAVAVGGLTDEGPPSA